MLEHLAFYNLKLVHLEHRLYNAPNPWLKQPAPKHHGSTSRFYFKIWRYYTVANGVYDQKLSYTVFNSWQLTLTVAFIYISFIVFLLTCETNDHNLKMLKGVTLPDLCMSTICVESLSLHFFPVVHERGFFFFTFKDFFFI